MNSTLAKVLAQLGKQRIKIVAELAKIDAAIAALSGDDVPASTDRKRRSGRTFSNAQRKEASARMKRYWASRKKGRRAPDAPTKV